MGCDLQLNGSVSDSGTRQRCIDFVSAWSVYALGLPESEVRLFRMDECVRAETVVSRVAKGTMFQPSEAMISRYAPSATHERWDGCRFEGVHLGRELFLFDVDHGGILCTPAASGDVAGGEDAGDTHKPIPIRLGFSTRCLGDGVEWFLLAVSLKCHFMPDLKVHADSSLDNCYTILRAENIERAIAAANSYALISVLEHAVSRMRGVVARHAEGERRAAKEERRHRAFQATCPDMNWELVKQLPLLGLTHNRAEEKTESQLNALLDELEFANELIVEMPLSVRTQQVLRKAGIVKFREVLMLSPEKIRAFKLCGKRSVIELQQAARVKLGTQDVFEG